MQPDRRSIVKLLGLSPLLGATLAHASGDKRLFTSGPLAGNPVAQTFMQTPGGLQLSDVTLVGSDGVHRLRDLKGKVRIVSLWAEWCLPCLLEAKDLGHLRREFAGLHFDILAILTGGRANLSLPEARAKLDGVGAKDLPTWVEPENGKKIGKALAMVDPPYVSIPCNLIIDESGRVRGRSIGRGQGEGPSSQWSGPEARRFVALLPRALAKP